MIGVSRCLLGECCTYKGTHHLDDILKDLARHGQVVGVCPEVLGGLPIPRNPAEIMSFHPLLIQTNQGKDVTDEYIVGARKALKIFLDNDVHVAVLKWRSPSCGNDGVYDGTFSHNLVDGQGVFASMCEEQGIRIFNENQMKEFLKYIGKEDDYGTYFKDSTSI